MKVLLAGMQIYDNQFTRALLRYGVDVVHTDPDPGRFDRRCDMLVVAKCQISHQKFWDVKEAYKGKPIFVATNGFTEVKERFEMALSELRAKRGVAILPPPPPEPEPEEPPKRIVTDRETSERVNKVVLECLQAGMSIAETVEMLESEDLRKASGASYGAGDVSTIRYQLRKRGLAPRVAEPPPPSPAPFNSALGDALARGLEVGVIANAEPPPEPKVEAPKQTANPMELIGLVVSSQLTPEQKVERIAKIQRGEIVWAEQSSIEVEGQVLAITVETVTSWKADVAILSKSMARAIVQHIGEVKKFAGLSLVALALFGCESAPKHKTVSPPPGVFRFVGFETGLDGKKRPCFERAGEIVCPPHPGIEETKK